MIRSVYPSNCFGEVSAIASKSIAHRALICAALSDTNTRIRCDQTNLDIEATVSCLTALGAKIERRHPFYEISPIDKLNVNENARLYCNESASTLRFLIPVVAALGVSAYFIMGDTLARRPLSPLLCELGTHGISFSYPNENTLRMEGKLNGESFSITGNVSSQFISGLLMALPLLDHSVCLKITEGIESAPYVDLTLDVLSSFGINYTKEKSTYSICARSEFAFQKNFDIEGDWSNAAPFLCMGVMGKGAVSVNRLSPNSKQGDFAIIELIKAFGGCIVSTDNGFTAYPSKLFGSDVDATQTPDLVPVLAVLASVAEGKTRIYGASRLRLKESDRLTSICEMLSTLGADIAQTEDGLIINGRPTLRGGRVRSYNDHRIVMAAAVAAVACETPVTIEDCEAVEKSYPSFFEHLEMLGTKITND